MTMDSSKIRISAGDRSYSDLMSITDTSVQQCKPGDLDHLFEELGEEWVEQDNDPQSSSIKSHIANGPSRRTNSSESLGFDFATTKIEAQNIKKTPEWKRAINKRPTVQEPVKKSSLENLFNPPPDKQGSTNLEKLTAIMENDESALVDTADTSRQPSDDPEISRQPSPIKIFSNHDTTTKARLEGLLGSFDSVGSSVAHTIHSTGRNIMKDMSTVQEISTADNSRVESGDTNRALTTQDYINDASDLMARLKQRGGPSTFSYATAEESSYNTSDLSTDTQSHGSVRKLNERNSLMELQQRISYFEDSSGSDYASSSISEVQNLSIKNNEEASKATIRQERSEIQHSRISELASSPEVKPAERLPPTSKYHPNMKQITPQYFAEHKDRFGKNINMEFDSLKGVWKRRSVSSTLYSGSNNEAGKLSQTAVVSAPIEIPKISEVAQEQDIFDGIDDLDEKIGFSSKPQVRDRTSSGSMIIHNTSGPADLSQQSSMHTVVYESFQSSTSSGSVIIANRSRKISQYGVGMSPISSPHVSSADAGPVTNISIVQASFSQALGETIRILPFDSEGREKEVQYLNIPPNDKLTTTRWVGKSHPNLEILQAPEGKLRYIQGLPRSLRELNLAHNEVEDLGSQFHKLVNLEVVNLSSNGLPGCAFLKSLIHLRDLNLANNKIESLDGLTELSNLQKLVLDGNDLKGAIDISATKWSNLDTLSIKRNSRISSIIGLGHEHCKLKELYADDNKKLELISGENKSQLLKLSVNNCPQLSQLALAQFPKLQILKCDNNIGLSEFKDGYVPRTLKSVTLRRHGKSMNQNMFAQLCEVQRLSLRNTPLEYLDFNNQFFLNLHVLDLSHCGLKKLPENFNERCCNLRVLDLSGNQISDISPIEGIPKLVSLNLLDNQISRHWFKVLLRTIRTLEQLTELETRDNPVSRKMYGEEINNDILQSRLKYRKAITDNSHGLNILDGESFISS